MNKLEQIKMKTVTLENRAWRGLRVYTPEFKHKKQTVEDGLIDVNLVLEIVSSHKPDAIMIQEYIEYTSKIHKNYDGSAFKSHSYGGYIDQTFKTFKEALEFIKNEYGLNCIYPEHTKEMFSDWTWEQNIIYAESGNKTNHDILQKMEIGVNVKVVELEVLRFIRDNPRSKTDFLQKKFESEIKTDFDYSILSRLCHRYSDTKEPLIKQESGECTKDPKNNYKYAVKNEGWLITDHGLVVIQEYEKQKSEKGFCDSSLY